MFSGEFPLETHVAVQHDAGANVDRRSRRSGRFVLHLSVVFRLGSRSGRSMSGERRAYPLFELHQHDRHDHHDVHSVSRRFDSEYFNHSETFLFERISRTRLRERLELPVPSFAQSNGNDDDERLDQSEESSSTRPQRSALDENALGHFVDVSAAEFSVVLFASDRFLSEERSDVSR